MKRIFTLLFTLTCLSLSAQDEAPPKAWNKGAGIGLDFAQLLQLNPKQGAGENRIGLGSAVNYFAKYKAGRVAWDYGINWQFGVQKLGAGLVVVNNVSEKRPFQKSIDELTLNSKLGFATAEGSKFFYAADLKFLTQLTRTFKGNFLTDIEKSGTPLSQIFSPARLDFSIGIDYKPTPKLSIFYSPVSYKAIIVLDDEIAQLVARSATNEILGSVHGNKIEVDPNDNTRLLTYDKIFNQVGSMLKLNYADKLMKDKLTLTSNLALFSNYLNNPQNIDVEWKNELAFNIYKGLALSLLVDVFYDHDVFVQVTDYDVVGGVNGLGRRVSLMQQLLIKYNIVF